MGEAHRWRGAAVETGEAFHQPPTPPTTTQAPNQRSFSTDGTNGNSRGLADVSMETDQESRELRIMELPLVLVPVWFGSRPVRISKLRAAAGLFRMGSKRRVS